MSREIKRWNSLKIIFMLFCIKMSNSEEYERSPNTSSSFVDECRMQCAASKDPLICGKYRAVQWYNDIVIKKLSYGPFHLIRLPSSTIYGISPQIPEIPYLRGSKELAKLLNFVRTSTDDLLTRRALVYTFDQSSDEARSPLLSSGPMLMDEEQLDQIESGKLKYDERIFHKKKKSIVLPILVLVKLFKLKLMLLPIIFGIHFIKKFLIVGSLIIPSILAHLKYCKIPPYTHQQPPYSYHSWSSAAEAPPDYPTGYGHEDAGWGNRNDVHGMQGYGGGVYHGPYAGYYHSYRQPQPNFAQ